MSHQPVIIHERLAYWIRQLRSRFSGCPIHWSETRSVASLLEAARASPCPIVVIGLDGKSARGLEDLVSLREVVPLSLTLVIDPLDRPDMAWLARELGATMVLSGVVVPPTVESWLRRWLPIARARVESAGWSPPIDPEPEPWERNDLFLHVNPAESL